jgi:hypothetical protein
MSVRGALIDRAPRRRCQSVDDDGFVHPRMDRADEQVRAWRQGAGGNRRLIARGHEVERTNEERWRCGRAEQDLVEAVDDPAAPELGDLREGVRLAAAILNGEGASGAQVHLWRREVPRAGELVLHQLLNEDAERRPP